MYIKWKLNRKKNINEENEQKWINEQKTIQRDERLRQRWREEMGKVRDGGTEIPMFLQQYF